MGRRPIIREAIIKVLKASELSLEPAVLRQRVAEVLHREKKDIAETNLYSNLSLLMENGQVEKQLIDGKPCYKLSSSFYLSENKSIIKSIIDLGDLADFIPRLENNHPPLTLYVENLENLTEPKRITRFFTINSDDQKWNDPTELISRRMLVTFSDLPLLEKEGIKNLLAHAYWYGVQSFISNFGKGTLNEVLLKSKEKAAKEINTTKEREETKWIDALKILLQILDITEKLPLQTNLDDLLNFFQKQSPEVSKLQKQLLSLTYENLNSGEKIFNRFLDYHGCVLVGLQAAGLVPQTTKVDSLIFRYLFNYSEVWNRLIFSIFDRFNFDNEFKNINESMKKTLVKIKKHEEDLLSLLKMPFRSKIFIVYLWGYPEIFSVSNKAFLPLFNEWLSALKEGNLDDRSWIFSEKTIVSLINTFKAVRSDIRPRDDIIDFVPWSIIDLYEYHPRGKDVDFWEEFLREIKLRIQNKPSNREVIRHISAALEGRYDL